MKNRTIEEIKDKEIGHKGFARFISLAEANGHKITNIKEYYSKFKFELDNHPFEWDKTVKFSPSWYLSLVEGILEQDAKIKRG